jgi:uncharacterized protein YkwD
MGHMAIARSRTLVLLTLALAALFVPAVADASVNCTPGAGWGTLNPQFEAQVAVQLNAQRAASGLPALAVSPILTASAEWKSLHMSEYQYFDHTDPAPPVARDAGQRMSDCGYTFNTATGENIAEGWPSVSSVVSAWMASEGHRENILSSAFTVVGVGVAMDAKGQYWWTTDFGGYADPGTVAAGSTPPPAGTTTTVTTTAPVIPPPPPPTAPVTTTPPPATTGTTTTSSTTTTTATATTKTALPKPEGSTTSGSSEGNPEATGTTAAAIGESVVFVARSVVHTRAGRTKVLHPLRHMTDRAGLPFHIVRILHQPDGSHARILAGHRAIRLRLPKDAKASTKLVYVARTASGVEAEGTVTIKLTKTT